MLLSTIRFELPVYLYSETAIRLGIKNEPTVAHLEALKYTDKMMRDMQKRLGLPIQVNSGYRSAKLNASIPGSSSTSQHSKGEAVDWVPIGAAPAVLKAVYDWIRTTPEIKFDQLIYEGGWIHISFSKTRARRSILKAVFRTGKATLYLAPDWTPKPYSPIVSR